MGALLTQASRTDVALFRGKLLGHEHRAYHDQEDWPKIAKTKTAELRNQEEYANSNDNERPHQTSEPAMRASTMNSVCIRHPISPTLSFACGPRPAIRPRRLAIPVLWTRFRDDTYPDAQEFTLWHSRGTACAPAARKCLKTSRELIA